MNLTKEEAQYVLNAIDTHIKQYGIKVAAMGSIIVSKLAENLKLQESLKPHTNGKNPQAGKNLKKEKQVH